MGVRVPGGTRTLTYATGDIGWHNGNSGSKTHPVGEKLPNAYGLFDMGGHVVEWTQDTFTTPGGTVDGSPVSRGEDPMLRVLRGTSFYWNIVATVEERSKGRVDETSRNNGFRVAAEKMR